MSDQLARTGTAAGAIIGGTAALNGWWLLLAAVGVIAAGALCVRLGFRRGQSADQR